MSSDKSSRIAGFHKMGIAERIKQVGSFASLSGEEMQHLASGELPQTSAGTIDFGLAVVCRIAQLHGGKVTAVNCPDGGTAFTLWIPGRMVLEKAA